jgi:DNA-binding IclR family transcriptional regulator
MAKPRNRRGPTPVQSVGRSLDLLEAVANDNVGLVALAERTGLGASTAYRLLVTLLERGYVARNPSTGRFRVGHKLVELAAVAARDSESLRSIARPHLEQLRNATDETANLVVRDGVSIVYVDQVESSRSVRMFTAIGSRVPLHSAAAGKAILAASPAAVFDERQAAGLERLTPHTLCTTEALAADLGVIRGRSFAIDSEEYELGVVCVAAVIRGPDGEPIGAVSVSGPAERMRATDLNAMGALVSEHAETASGELGALIPRAALG